MLNYIKDVLINQPADWLNLTTHRLDIYNEALAKTQFLEQFELLYKKNDSDSDSLKKLPTAFDYIRLGHPLSCVLEWVIAEMNEVTVSQVISFASKTTPIMAILRKNLLAGKKTRVLYTNSLPECFDVDVLKDIYSYDFDVLKIEQTEDDIAEFDGSTVLVLEKNDIHHFNRASNIDLYVNIHESLGSVVLIDHADIEQAESYVSEVQHVRRRETIAMTPANCDLVLKTLVGLPVTDIDKSGIEKTKASVLDSINHIVGTDTKVLVASSGLSIQYAILMGLIHDAMEQHPGKPIKIIVPPNCYGGTNDQARRVADCIDLVDVLDLPVDGGNDMVQGIHAVLSTVAESDAIPLIIAEIPTNPRVEVPDLLKLKEALSEQRKTSEGEIAVDPVFILDQTFCPNVHFLGENDILSNVRTISYSSGSKFPSGGKCIAGYCVANKKADALVEKIDVHLKLCDNQATALQMSVLAKQLPTMKHRIHQAYLNTREFVNFIQETLPEAHINFVSEELASQGFTPSVFSLDLPTKGETVEEKEAYKRALNHQLINMMITEIPNESKYCVSYGQLSGCYWTIPATSTQGTTKEGDKDYIARVAVSADLDLERHKQVFLKFVESMALN